MIEIDTFTSMIEQSIPGIQIISDPHILRHYAVDGLVPRLVVTPASVEEISQIIALTSEHGLTVLVRGGGAGMNHSRSI